RVAGAPPPPLIRPPPPSRPPPPPSQPPPPSRPPPPPSFANAAGPIAKPATNIKTVAPRTAPDHRFCHLMILSPNTRTNSPIATTAAAICPALEPGANRVPL